MKRFWVCYVQGTNGGQHHGHEILKEAQAEAERLARKEGKPVCLFECIGICKAEPIPVKWEILR